MGNMQKTVGRVTLHGVWRSLDSASVAPVSRAGKREVAGSNPATCHPSMAEADGRMRRETTQWWLLRAALWCLAWTVLLAIGSAPGAVLLVVLL